MSRSIDCIAKHRSSSDRLVTLAVIRSFGKLFARDHADWLATFATHPDPVFREQAVIALGKILDASIPPKLDTFALADPKLAGPVAFGKTKIRLFVDAPTTASVTELVRLELESDEYEDLIQKVPFVAKPLDDIVKSPAEPLSLRLRALRILSLGRLPAIAMTYFWVLGQKPLLHEDLRFEAIIALGRLHMRGADKVLVEQMLGASPRLCRAAIWALGQIGKGSVIEPLLQGWDLEEGALRPMIAMSARKLAKVDGAPLLSIALDEDRATPQDALLFFDDDASITRGLPDAKIEALLLSPEPRARRDAALLFGCFGPPSRSEVLRQLADRETDPAIQDIALRGWARLERLRLLMLTPP